MYQGIILCVYDILKIYEKIFVQDENTLIFELASNSLRWEDRLKRSLTDFFIIAVVQCVALINLSH